VKERGRPTTEKQRVIGNLGHQLVRLDYERTDSISVATEKALLARVAKELPAHGALLISDYAKGVLSPRTLASCIALARRRRVPVLCDPKPRDPSYLKAVSGVTLLTPNLGEAQRLAGSDVAVADLGLRLKRATGGAVLVTMGADGMALFPTKGEMKHFPALAKGVVDVSGAGDTVAGVMALATAAGLTLLEGAVLASRAAAIVVEKPGTATVTLRELRAQL
jgi:D-beta-D-heptose 7-phosphate kinase/D-beta-D-heptose 1-phosphate adenosyltransferase